MTSSGINEENLTNDFKSFFMKKIISTTKAPLPIGPYSQAVLSGGLLFTSGQIAIDPETGKLVIEDIQTETIRVMENLKAVLSEANGAMRADSIPVVFRKAGERCQGSGGFKLVFGPIEIDSTVEGIIQSRRQDLEEAAASVLFGDGGQ